MKKRFISYVMTAMVLAPWAWSAGLPAATLPDSIHSTLDQEYPGWKLAKHPPSLVSADFDRNGKRDYAIQIVLPPSVGEAEQIVIVYLQQADGSGFQEIILQSQGLDPGMHLSTSKKMISESTPDGVTNLIQQDVLTVLGSAIGDTTYAYQNGEFHELIEDKSSEKTDIDTP